MGVTFTKEQQKVINLRNCNILVSAAAGSGKTAVLVERIITRLTKDKSPLDVDQMLIVTFTEAAASEMKERIYDAIEKALMEEPENVHLQRQATLIHQAQITTIHKFCLSVIRDYFHMIDLDPGFRVGEEGELKLLQKDVVGNVMEAAYQEGTEEYLSFVESFATGRDDRNIEELILQLYEFSRSYPNPEVWLDSCAVQYEMKSEKELEEKGYIQELLNEVRLCLQEMQSLVDYGIKLCEEEDGPASYKNTLISDLDKLKLLVRAETYGEMQSELCDLKWATLTANRNKEVDEKKILKVKSIREEIKGYVKEVKERFFYAGTQQLFEDMCAAGNHMRTLTKLVKEFANQFSVEKRNKNLIDFSDMEQYALRILTKEEDGAFAPSEVAEVYQRKYAEVMIDEYQDSNLVQEAILTSVSGVSKGVYNVFMVGDVKQSIYRFRLSRPELFMEKFDTYSLTDGEKQRIDLHKNFRSRREVLDSVNFFFEQIMISSFGGIQYDDKAALYVGADYEDKPGNETEILLIECPESSANERIELEAEAIGKRIKEIMETQEVFDKTQGGYRPVRYSDIVILTRSLKGWTDVFSKVLNNAGIPTYTGSKEGYFEAQEIKLALNYLKILDNPRQDIPFTSVLTSMFAGLSSEDLAILRSASDGKHMYDCVCNYVKDGGNTKLKEKLCAFLSTFEQFRDRLPYMAIHELLWKLLVETGYGDYVAALPGGEQRAANLEMLVEKAIAYEGTSYKGLFNFVRYIEQLQKYAVDYGEANIMDENMDVVSLMSIHKSKGLEFPIVFVAGMGKQFNMQDTRKNLVVHADLGIGIDSVDAVMRTKVPTILKKIIQLKTQRESTAEELRVLYVAMTRAKEKLILTGAITDLEKEFSKINSLQTSKKRELPYYSLVKATKYLDWILPSLNRNRNYAEVPIKVQKIVLEDLADYECDEQLVRNVTKEILSRWDTELVYDALMKELIEAQLSFAYPYKENQIVKQKLSVSELKKKSYQEEGEEVFKEEEVIPLLPRFLQEEKELTGASKGTAYHKLLELLDLSKDYDETILKNEIIGFVEEGYLTEEMATCIHVEDILDFLRSSIGERVKAACRNGKYCAEQPFVMGLKAREVYPDIDLDEYVLVQGIIDVYFEEDGELVVLDYKTDRVGEAEELVKRYQAQLRYYAKALQRLTGKTVKENVIYSFDLQEEILC